MDSKVSLLKAFSRTFLPGTAKIETEEHGFDFLDRLLSDGAELAYGELTTSRLLHKYRLVGVSERKMDELLAAHVAKACNVCRYFGAEANDTFCFNLDNNHKVDNTRLIPEMELAVGGLRDRLLELRCEPLVVASGRGFHLWCRLAEPVENSRLNDFMIRAAVRALLPFHDKGYNPATIKFSFYPDVRVHSQVSLRLFGSDHAKNRVFSRVLTPDGLADESASWGLFEEFVRCRAISSATFGAAQAALNG